MITNAIRMILTNETFARDGRAIEGTVPCIQLENANILVTSLGASAGETAEIAKRIRDALNQQASARAMLVALKKALTEIHNPGAYRWANKGEGDDIAEHLAKIITQAEKSGISL